MAISQKALRTAVMPMANSIARGTSRVGFTVSSASPPAESKPYMTHAPVSMAARNALPYPNSAPGPAPGVESNSTLRLWWSPLPKMTAA